MKISATRLRQNLYKILDEVIESGTTIEIERKGTVLKIVPEKPLKKTNKLKKQVVINGDPESIIEVDWEKNWSEEDNI